MNTNGTTMAGHDATLRATGAGRWRSLAMVLLLAFGAVACGPSDDEAPATDAEATPATNVEMATEEVPTVEPTAIPPTPEPVAPGGSGEGAEGEGEGGGDADSAGEGEGTEGASEEGAADDAGEEGAMGDDTGEMMGALAELDEASMAPEAPSDRAGYYSEPVDMQLQPEAYAYFADIATTKGDIRVQLFPEAAPEHVNSFVFLSEADFFDGLTFHRVVPGFVIQGGDPTGTGSAGPGYQVPAEFNEDNPIPHREGTLAMARSSDPDSGGSQWYIVLEDSPSASNLDGSYTVFGHVVEGMDVVRSIAVGDVIDQVEIEALPASESVVTPDDIREGNLPVAR